MPAFLVTEAGQLDYTVSVCVACSVCRGTHLGLTHTEGHYAQYSARYTNCTYVDGNLELVFLTNASYDLSFLRHIREVSTKNEVLQY